MPSAMSPELRKLVKFDRFWASVSFALFALLAGALDQRWLTLAALIVSIGFAIGANDIGRPMRRMKNLAGFSDVSVRLIRFSAVLAIGWHTWENPWVIAAFAICGLGMNVGSVAALITNERLAECVTPSIFTRNLSVTTAPIPRTIAWVASGIGMAIVEVVFVISALLVTDNGWSAWGLGLLVLIATLALVALTEYLTNGPGAAYRSAALASVQRAIVNLHPEVALYVGAGRSESAYQVESWLATIEKVDEPCLVIVRSLPIYGELGPTSAPMVALGNPLDLLALDLSTVRATLFIANTGDTIHLLREQNPMSAFIGHGDSDKNSSFNPFTKVYDQVWISGPAGADRYNRAEIGVHPEQFVQVGRPQLDIIDRDALDRLPKDRVKTVLYAPTWEGWNNEQEHCSLLAQGPELIERLVATPGIRVIYKPHPFTGIRSHRARAAHNKILKLLKNPGSIKDLPPSQMSAKQRASAQSGSATELQALSQQFGADFFGQCDPSANIVIRRDSDVNLFSCFEYADALVTDVSSVLSDFISVDRPYAVCDTTDLGTLGFIEEYPSAGGGIIISRDGAGIDELIATVLGTSEDQQAQRRREVRGYLIGDGELSGTELFKRSVTGLIQRANERIEHRSQRAQRARELSQSDG